MDFEESDSEADRNAGAEDLKSAKIITSDLSPECQLKIVRYCLEAMKTTKMDKDAASQAKKKMDEDPAFREGGLGAWQVLIGRSFAACVTHETKYLMYFNLIPFRRTILAFKSQ